MISKGSVEKEAEEPKSICGRSFTGFWSKRYGRTFCWVVVSAASVAGWPDESRAKCGVGGFGGILLMKSLLLHPGKELDPLVTAISCIRPRTAPFVGGWTVDGGEEARSNFIQLVYNTGGSAIMGTPTDRPGPDK